MRESSTLKRHSPDPKRRPLQPVSDNIRNNTNGQKKGEGDKPHSSCKSQLTVSQPKEEHHDVERKTTSQKRDSSEFISDLHNFRPKKRVRAEPEMVSIQYLVSSLYNKLRVVLTKMEEGRSDAQIGSNEENSGNPDISILHDDLDEDAKHSSRVWVMKWVDYSQKYGLGYVLSNHVTGVSFNDFSRIALDQTKR